MRSRAVHRLLAPALLAAVGTAGMVGCARRYTTTGVVLRVDEAGSKVLISHEAFPGLMDAMVMAFERRGSAAETALAPGDRVRVRLAVRGQASWLDRIEVLSAARVDAGLETTPVSPVLVPIGAPVPDFALTDQSGADVRLSAFRGRVVAVTFIYTRCPLPDYCPRMMANLRSVRDRFSARMGTDLALFVVTFDPQYDTPERLRAFAAVEHATDAGWHFLTGDAAAIERVCQAFGIQYWPEEGLITHTLQTAIIDREGTLAAAVEGREYTARQLGDLVGDVLDR
jgi:protein SCO1/2